MRPLYFSGGIMIAVTRYNNTELVINADLIEFIEATPDTIITTTTGKKIMVRDSVDKVIDKVVRISTALS